MRSPPNGSLTLQEIFSSIQNKSYIHSVLSGRGQWGVFLVKCLVCLVFISTLSFALSTVPSLQKYQKLFSGIDYFCVLIFTAEYIIRVYVSEKRVEYICQAMSLIDLASILPSWVNMCSANDLPRLQFMRLLRLFKFLISTKRGSKAVDAFHTSWVENYSLMLAASYVGMSLWLLASSLQYLIEYDNDDMLWCYPETITNGDGCVCDDEACTGPTCICVHRYGSLPSALFYTLMEFSGTYMLASQHSCFGRVVATCTAVISVGIFAVPTSLFAAALNEAVCVIHDAKSDVDEIAPESDEERWSSCSEISRSTSDSSSSPLFETNNLHRIALQASAVATSMYSTSRVPLYTLTPWYASLTKALISASVVSSIVGTVHLESYVGFMGRNVAVYMFLFVDIICATVFGFEHIVRVAASGPRKTLRHMFDVLSLADLLSWAPSVVLLCGAITEPPPAVSLTIAFFRLIKYERHTNGFWILFKVIENSWGLLSVGGTATVCIVMFASTLLYYTESQNPDPNVRRYYDTVPMALWTTMINISGAPVVDYSPLGKFVASFLALLSVAVFAVPIGAIGSDFQTVMDDMSEFQQRQATIHDLAQKTCSGLSDGESTAMRHALSLNPVRSVSTYDNDENALSVSVKRSQSFSYGSVGSVAGQSTCTSYPSSGLYSSLPPEEGDDTEHVRHSNLPFQRWVQQMLQQGSNSNIGVWFTRVSVGVTLLSTVVEIVTTCAFARTSICQTRISVIEFVVVMWFSFEYIIRACAHGFEYMTSSLGMLDAATTLPWYVAQVIPVVDRYDGFLRAFRLLRILRLDAYMPSLSLIDDAIEDCSRGLSLALYAFLVLWFSFNQWMYLAERYAANTEASHFGTALQSLQYSGMLLTGSYGQMDLTLAGQLCCCVAIIAAVGIATVPASILATAFVNVLREEAEINHKRKLEVALMAQKLFRFRQTTIHSMNSLVRKVVVKKRSEELTGIIYKWMNNRSLSWYPSINIFVILVNTALIILSTVAAVKHAVPHIFWQGCEVIFVLYFTMDYALTLITIRHNLSFGCSIKKYMLSFSGIAAFVSIAPFYAHQLHLLLRPGIVYHHKTVVAIEILRIFRVVGLDKYIRSFYYLSSVLGKVAPVLTAAGIVALVVWVGAGTLFYFLERNSTDTVFVSIPMSLYYCAMFLVGDWEVIDFSPIGSVLCVFLSLFGVTLFAVPVGILFEGFQDVMTESHIVAS